MILLNSMINWRSLAVAAITATGIRPRSRVVVTRILGSLVDFLALWYLRRTIIYMVMIAVATAA